MATVNVEYLAGDVPGEFICAYGARVDALSHRLLSSLAAAGPALEHSIESLREFLWSTASRTPPLPRIARAREALADVQGEAPVASLAAKLEMHRGQLHRAFKRAYGESPRCNLSKRRAARAVCLLVETSLSVAEVAAECGYYDQSHFCRQFRLLSGMSPSQFRAAFAR
jgi:AraC-like DNA-binding protein